jgi:hypothetical protein
MTPPSLLKVSALLCILGAYPAAAQEAPVLVELFTSQGCSSCPPAESWLNSRGMELFKRGKIAPLAFHVDYWDYLGWKDPFSSQLFTERQRKYAQALNEHSLYTPQMIVAGKVGFVGSDSARAMEALADPENQKAGLIQLKNVGGRLVIRLPLGANGKLWLAVFENQKSTKVLDGENDGKTLEENFIVTRLEELHSLAVPIPAGTGIVVFSQDDSTMKITAVGCLAPK